MIISHKYKYVFVELPRTGSTAVSKELRDLYDGQRMLKKHSTYTEFLKTATPEEKKYFAFAAIRNPMDKLVSLYFKYKYDHRNYGDPDTFRGNNVFVKTLMQNQFRFVRERGASFPDFFRRYYHLPYDDWSSLDHAHLQYILRFENLAEDFADVLRRMNVTPQRPLPVVNKTQDRESDFWSYYTPETRNRARWVFGPYFKRWGYKFPTDWTADFPASSQWAFAVTNLGRHFYWRHLR